MANKKIYEVEVTGTDKAAEKLRAFENAMAQRTTAAAQAHGGLLQQVGASLSSGLKTASAGVEGFASKADVAFKSVARDIDVVGGKLTADIGMGLSNLLGVVGAISGGGAVAGIAAVGAAIGGIAYATQQWAAEEEKIAKEAKKIAEEHEKLLLGIEAVGRALAENSAARSKGITEEMVAQRDLQIASRGFVEAQLILEAFQVEQRRRASNDWRERLKLDGEAKEAQARVDAFREETARIKSVRDDEFAASEKTAIDKKETELREKIAKDADDKAARARQDELALRKLQAKEGAEYEIAFQKSIADFEALVMEDEKARKDAELRQDQARAAAMSQLQRIQQGDNPALAAELTRHNQKMTAKQNAIDKEKELAAAIYERGRAQVFTNATTAGLDGATMALGVTSMVTNTMMQPLIQTLQVYGTINRENWRDLLEFNEDFRNNMAAQVQIALWSLAQQAAGKAVFEAGEGFREQAQALGAAATGNFVSAGLHQTSAMIHFVARDAYAGIAGASAGASVGVGMQRGDGGMFGLTKEERERKERDRGGGETRMPGQGGPAARGGGGGSDGPVVVNFVYEAGAIDARSRDAAAATVAEASRHARRSGFTNRMMRA